LLPDRRYYRADIDGLRALAVISVVLFHAGFYRFSGGFVGVDVFFVISGFLITGIILRDLAEGKFSYAHFYERRVRRIIPALALTLLVVCLATLVLSSPSRVQAVGKSLLFSSFFATNLLFAQNVGYFDSGAVGQPLLHTWSLAVEEQYYLVYPAMLALLWRSRRSAIILLCAALFLSFGYSAWATTHMRKVAFYSIFSRAWELFLGGILAAGTIPKLRSRAACEGLAIVGMVAVAWAVLSLDATVPFPGLAALLPVVGTAAIIHAAQERPTVVSRGLALTPLVAVGLISYSLYLWHWPVLMFARDFLGDQLRTRYVLACIAVSVLLAIFSWFVVERPIRARRLLATRKQVFVAAAVAQFAAGLAGAYLASSSGLLWRYPDTARKVLAFTEEDNSAWRYASCFTTPEAPKFLAATCLRSDGAKPNILLLGDSHAADLRFGFDQVFRGANVLQANASGCLPVLGGPGQDHCTALRDYVFHRFLPRHRVDAVIVSAGWDNDETAVERIADTVEYLERFAAPVIVVGPTPSFDRPEPELLAADLRFGQSLAQLHLKDSVADLDRRMRVLAAAQGWAYFSPYQALCRDAHCRLYAAPGVPLNRDDSHLTLRGSLLVAKLLKDELPDRF
jgi:peptidoglycan/LPS O-acetylase OafA/YrhL